MNSGSRYVSYDPVDSPLITVVGLGVYYARPAPTRSFPILTNGSGDVVYPEFAYPVRGRVFSLPSSSNRFPATQEHHPYLRRCPTRILRPVRLLRPVPDQDQVAPPLVGLDHGSARESHVSWLGCPSVR